MNYQKSKIIKNQKKPWLLIVFVTLAVVGVALLALELTGTISLFSTTVKQPESTQPSNTINYDPPTEEELQAVEDNKQRISEESNTNSEQQTTGGQKITVKPVIGYIEISEGQINANGFISSMIEEGGTCTFTIQNGSTTKQATSTSMADAQSTICGLMQIPLTGVGSGEWSATLNYSSTKYQGVSDAQTFTVE